MSTALVRLLGYALMTFAVLWFALNGACSVSMLGERPGDYGGPEMMIVLSPLIFGPAIVAWVLARLIVGRARDEDAGRAAGARLKWSWVRSLLGGGLALLGLMMALSLSDSLVRNVYAEPTEIEVIAAAPPGVTIVPTPEPPPPPPAPPQPGFWQTTRSNAPVLHLIGIGVLLTLMGLWIAAPVRERRPEAAPPREARS